METRKVFFILEGKDDKSFLIAFGRAVFHDKEWGKDKNLFLDISVENKGKDGEGKAKEKFKVSVKNDIDKYHTVIIILDADNAINAKYQFIRETIKQAGYTDVPSSIPTEGLYLPATADLPAVAAWIMPDNTNNGALESFLQKCIKQKDEVLFLHVQETVRKLPEKRFKEAHTPKAELHTWLAWQQEPSAGIFEGIEKKFFDMDAPVAVTFAKWLKRCMGE